MMHQLHHPEKNIDILFVGSSHVYRALVPDITDEKMNAFTFNGGSSAQRIDSSYAVIREADKYNDLNEVYLELYYGVLNRSPFKERTNMIPTYIISDYIAPAPWKVKYLCEASSPIYWSNSFIPARRNWNRLFDEGYVVNTIKN